MTAVQQDVGSMPHAYETEQAVLGALLLDNSAWYRVGDLLTAGDFHWPEHRLIYGAIGSLVAHSKPADVITVFESLQRQGRAQEAGRLSYLNALAQSVPSAANARLYAQIVWEKSQLRRLIRACEGAKAAATAQDKPAMHILRDACEAVGAVAEQAGQHAHDAKPLATLVTQMLDRVQELHEGGADDVTGLRTGFADFDRLTTGLQPGDLFVLAARPSMGKTALALNIAEHVALRERLPVLVFSLEMSAAQLTLRLVSSLGRIDLQRLRTARLTGDDWERLTDAVHLMSGTALLIDDAGGLRTQDLGARARRIARQFPNQGLGLVVVDYLQLVASRAQENRATELAEISRALKVLAKDLGCPVLALSQLNRSVEARNDKRPVMSDLRDSGAIEQDADIVAFLYRDDYYDKASVAAGTAELIVAKQRNGDLGSVRLAFTGSLSRFDSPTAG